MEFEEACPLRFLVPPEHRLHRGDFPFLLKSACFRELQGMQGSVGLRLAGEERNKP